MIAEAGLGRRLLAAVAAGAATWDAARIKLSAHAGNAAAARFCRGLGVAADRDELSCVVEGQGHARLKGAP